MVSVINTNEGQILIADLSIHEGPVSQVALAYPMYGNCQKYNNCFWEFTILNWKWCHWAWD
uniref:Uncharacterized protein n=1 Tax=Erpetoichthys calabaricus TaxID=27687 RepID=A0A8C4RQU7_ERPCA